MKTIIYTSFDCLIKAKNIEETLNKNEHLCFELESQENISVYPKNRNQVPFNIDFNVKNSNFYRIIHHKDKLLVFLLDGLIMENISCHHFVYENIKSDVEIYKNQIRFLCPTNKKIIHINSSPKNIECGHIYHINYVLFDDEEQKKLIAYNIKTNNAKIFLGNKIEINNNDIIVTYSKFGYEKIVENYYIDKEGLKIKNKTFAQAYTVNQPETVIYKFLNAITVEDYENALNYLNNDLHSQIDEKTLKEFFGKISYFFMIDINSAFVISDNKNKIFNFDIKDGKITEIYD